MNRALFSRLFTACALFGGSLLVAPAAAGAQPDPLQSLRDYLHLPRHERPVLAEQVFASLPLTQAQSQKASELLWNDHRESVRQMRSEEVAQGKMVVDDKTMLFTVKKFGQRPAAGHALFISLHGGGNAPARVNDGQWKNQQRLYELEEGIYVAPRAPTNSWNLWHEAHIDALLDRLIESMIAIEQIDSNRVYLLGYSAGGDGVYQLAPRMADRFAAAAMMAGHPNEASPLGLRNLPFAIHVGEKDGAYNRNSVARQWHDQLESLQSVDTDGYQHVVKLHAGKGHWMDRQDAEAIAWMAGHSRQVFPKKVVWHQDDVIHSRFYWLATEQAVAQAGDDVTATVNGQAIDLVLPEGRQMEVRLCDRLVDLDRPIRLTVNGQLRYDGLVERTIATLALTLSERGDPVAVCSARISVR